MIRIGIIGGSRIAPGHAQAIRNLGNSCELIAVASSSAERARSIAEPHGAEAVVDWRTLLVRTDIDAVVVATPNPQHVEMGTAALRAGKHLLIEKPMAMTLAECDGLIQVAQDQRRKLFVGHTQHFFSTNQAARALLSSGELGSLVTFTDTWYKPFGVAVRRPWFLDRSTGGGMWFMNGAHMVDRALWFNDSKVTTVKAWIGNPLLGLKADDTNIAVLQHANGKLSTLVHAGYEVGDERWHGEFVCTKGMMRLSTFPPGAGLWTAKDASGYAPVKVEEREALTQQMDAFVNCIDKDLPETIAPIHARHVMAVLLAAEESSRTGRETSVGP
ncbi:MAG: Gfo/Idh/MocA family oxidoreductase [Deltaproteobacteria bacterium]|nr:Gfo/Idh/MocA family oxidoreductase [Deltaproteobacteria bacterium]